MFHAYNYMDTLTRVAHEHSAVAYLVGGSVRDAILGRELKDFDFALSAACENVARSFARTIGASFFWLDEPRQQARVLKKESGGSVIFDFSPLRGDNIESDLLLRDFTINAMACAITLGGSSTIIDPAGGLNDLANGVIRGCAPTSFTDDPLRLLRAVRFSATLGFAIERSTWQLLQTQSNLLDSVAGERLRGELFQILAAPKLKKSLRILLDSKLLPLLLPIAVLKELTASANGECHPVLADMIDAADRIEEIIDSLPKYFPNYHEQLLYNLQQETEAGVTALSLVKLAAFLNYTTIFFVAKKLKLGKISQQVLQALMQKTRVPPDLTDRAMYRFFRDQHPAGPELVFSALATGTIPEEICRRLVAYYFREYDPHAADLLLSGTEVMHLLNLQQGASVGHALEQLRQAEKSGTVNTKAEAEAFLAKNLLTKEGAIG